MFIRNCSRWLCDSKTLKNTLFWKQMFNLYSMFRCARMLYNIQLQNNICIIIRLITFIFIFICGKANKNAKKWLYDFWAFTTFIKAFGAIGFEWIYKHFFINLDILKYKKTYNLNYTQYCYFSINLRAYWLDNELFFESNQYQRLKVQAKVEHKVVGEANFHIIIWTYISKYSNKILVFDKAVFTNKFNKKSCELFYFNDLAKSDTY